MVATGRSKKNRRTVVAGFRSRAPVLAPRGALAAEMHYFDQTMGTADLTTTPQLSLLNGMAQGPDIDERLGNKIVMKSIEIKLAISNEASNPAFKTYGHFMVVYDRQSNGVAPNVTDVIASTVNGMKNIGNRDRFLILKDWMMDLNTFGSAATGVTNLNWYKHVFINLKGLQTTYNGAAAGIGTITTGALYVYRMGQIAAGTADFDVSMVCRLRFYA